MQLQARMASAFSTGSVIRMAPLMRFVIDLHEIADGQSDGDSERFVRQFFT
jgi:hypothetical protein